MKKLLLGLILVTIFNSCENEKTFYTGNFPLRQLIKDTTKVKSMSGSYFLIAGRFNSEERDERKIKMYALCDSVYNYLEYNLEDVKIKIDNSVEIPYIYLGYTGYGKQDDYQILSQPYYYPTVFLVCSEKYLPEKLLEIGL